MYKVAIIGAGVVGAMAARRLSAYDIEIVILEKEADVAMGQSKANSGIVHAGYDPMPGSLKALLNVKGSEMMEAVCQELGVSYRRNGTLIVAFEEGEFAELQNLYERGVENGVKGLKIIDGKDARKIEKNLSNKVKRALYAPTGAVVCPYELTIEAIANAMDNGTELLRNFEVTNIANRNDSFLIDAEDGRQVEAQYVINCAGVYSDKIASMIGDDSFEITPRSGEYILLDKETGDLTNATIFKTPDIMGKGVLVTRTVDGNILLGPTSIDRESKEDLKVTSEGIESIKKKSAFFFDNLPLDKAITQFTGLRAHGNTGDFIINSPVNGFINAAGIESPGLTSAPAIALAIEEKLIEGGFDEKLKENYNPITSKGKDFSKATNEEKMNLIKENPDYGHIVCRCEEVTVAEIREAIRREPGAVDVDGIKRRTRSGMGRCQGGFCVSQVVEILSEELNLSPEEITKKGANSKILIEKVKGGIV